MKSAFAQAESLDIATQFGPELKAGGLASSIIASCKNDDLTHEGAKQALDLYKGLDVSVLTHKPSRIRRVGVYIGFLTLMYLILSGIYLTYVIPQNLAMFEVMDIPTPARFMWFVNNWAIISVVIILILIGAFLISKTIKDMFDYDRDMESSWVYRFLLPKRMREEYEKLISLMHLPLFIGKNVKDGINDQVIEYYQSDGMSTADVSQSLSLLMREHLSNLIAYCESYMRRIYVVVAILIVFTIFEFIVSAYTPLFVMGDVS
ncbi:hypothetical protein ACFOEK_02135 [Litoribrevibacter euphylliae]|uniref:Type II secretion system protein GspF domain-containing protein n=1 Tax=Litoribrevibacter euphylliae TaxID=1834034 RepID=A0ABV7H7S4_9GAMM